MLLYNYSEDGFYLSEKEARENPMVPGSFLLPAKSTFTAPPAAVVGFIAKFDGATWALVEDHRGETYWNSDNQEVTITTPGVVKPPLSASTPRPKDGYVIQNGEWVPDLDALRLLKKAQIEVDRDAFIYSSVSVFGHTWQADARSQTLLINAITMVSLGLPLPPVWRDMDNNDVTLTNIIQLVTIAGTMAGQTQMAYSQSWLRKQAVDEAIDEAGIIAA